MNKFSVSVVVPIYNAEKYIRTAILSALALDEVEEVVVIEDGSPDESLKISVEMAASDSRIRVFQHSDRQNHGAGASRNLGIQKSKCEYIAFLDADDYYLPSRFKKDKEIFSREDIDGVYSAVGTDYYEEVPDAAIPKQFVTTLKKQTDPQDLFFSLLSGTNGWIHSDGITVNKRVFSNAGFFDPALKMSQDTDMWLRAAAVCRLLPGEIENPVAMRGVHSQNRINDAEKLKSFRPLLFAKLFKWAKEKNLDAGKKKALWSHYYHSNIDQLHRSKLRRLSDAFSQAIENPFLLGYSGYYKTIPFLNRILR